MLVAGYSHVFKTDPVPILWLKGDTWLKKSENMPWYKGPTFAESLDILGISSKAGRRASWETPGTRWLFYYWRETQ